MSKDMGSERESQCYFVQLQFDSYLDGELSQGQREQFQLHVQQCQDCTREFQYAQTVHDHVLDLPRIDCDDRVLEPIYRLGGSASAASKPASGFWTSLQDLLASVPVFVRYAVPLVLLVAVIVPVTRQLSAPAPAVPVAVNGSAVEPVPEYTMEEIQQALRDLNLAIDYLNGVGQRTEAMIGDRFLLAPLQETLDASFEKIRRAANDPLQNDPI